MKIKGVQQGINQIWPLWQLHIKSGIGAKLWALLLQGASAACYAFVFGTLLGILGQGDSLRQYLPFLLCGLAPWFYYQRAMSDAAQCPTALAPLIRFQRCSIPVLCWSAVLGRMPLYILWVGIALIARWILLGAVPLSAWLCMYYLGCGALNAFAQGLLGAVFSPFFGDVQGGLRVMLVVLFWTTPILWPAELLPQAVRVLLSLNPLYYIVEGLRGCILDGSPWLGWQQTLWFFGITIATMAVGLWCAWRLKDRYFKESS